MDIKDCIIYEKTIPAHPAVYDDFPENLLPELAGYLKEHGIENYIVIRRKCLRK
jgi:DEAD/DEAH box helicase domain-containing protein